VVGVGIGNARTYFVKQARDPAVLFAYSPNESAVGRYLAALEGDPYILMTPQYSHHSAVKFIGRRPVTSLNLALHLPLREDVGRDLIYVLEPVDERLGPLFQQVYPGGTWQVHRDAVHLLRSAEGDAGRRPRAGGALLPWPGDGGSSGAGAEGRSAGVRLERCAAVDTALRRLVGGGAVGAAIRRVPFQAHR